MYDELTQVDIDKMQEEINHRVRVLRPQLIEEVQTARAFGDLSENFADAGVSHHDIGCLRPETDTSGRKYQEKTEDGKQEAVFHSRR